VDDQQLDAGGRPSVTYFQPKASPSTVPGPDLINLDENKTSRHQDKEIDLPDPAFVVDEFEVRPRPPRFVVRKVGAQARRNSSASCSHSNDDRLMATRFGGFIEMRASRLPVYRMH
jgi:hypothetical protein